MNYCEICEENITAGDPDESMILQFGTRRYILCNHCASILESAIPAMENIIQRTAEGEVIHGWAMRLDTYDGDGIELISSRIIEQIESAERGEGE